MSNNTAVALFLAADVFYRFKNPNTGVFGNPVKIETAKFQVSTPSDLKEKLSKGRETFNQAFVSVRSPKPVEFEAEFSQANRDVFALMLSGVAETVNQAVQTLTDEPVTVVLDEWVDIGFTNLNTTGLTVKNASGTVTYDLGSDYELNPRLGLVKALSSGSMAAGVVHVSGATKAVTGTKIIGARQYKTTLQIQVDAKNQVNNKDVLFKALQATVSSEEAHDFLSGDLDSVKVKGRLEIPDGGDRPFDMTLFD